MGLFDRLFGRTAPSGPSDVEPEVHEVAESDQDRAKKHEETKGALLFPRSKFQGEFTPENLAFDSNLQEFAQRVAYICSLENSGKITPDDAHKQIKALYKQLTKSHRGLNIDQSG